MRDLFGDRMKKYENVSRAYLTARTPVIIRVDGKAFHTFTRGFNKPFDELFVQTMQDTMKFLCENVQGCVLGYTQSDEISLLLVDYKTINTEGWFNYNVQKMASIVASMATLEFNRRFGLNAYDYLDIGDEYVETINKSADRGGMFDARCFNVPKDEVCNYFLWRQSDAVRNSICTVGRAFFSDKRLHKKSSAKIKEMLSDEIGLDWLTYPTKVRRGSCCVKERFEAFDQDGNVVVRNRWKVDNDIPLFRGDDRTYVNALVYVGGETCDEL